MPTTRKSSNDPYALGKKWGMNPYVSLRLFRDTFSAHASTEEKREMMAGFRYGRALLARPA